jgi:hypothetical protein
MPLICPNCRTVFTDPGGDPRSYSCSNCGYAPLQRTPLSGSNDATVGLVAGAAVGAALGGVPGAVIGALVGAIVGARNQVRPQRQ